MTPREANVLLTHAALLDGRLRREPEERAQMATAWAKVLVDVPLDVALIAVECHYREETRSVMPADIVALVEEIPATAPEHLEDARSWLEARGIDADEFQALVAAGESPTRVMRELTRSEA